MNRIKKIVSSIRLTRLQKLVLTVIGVLTLYMIPSIITGQYWGRIFNQAIINMLVVLGLNLLSGYLGLLNVGAVGMVALGAYSTALLATRLGLSMWIGLIAAIFVGALVGMGLGATCLKLNGIYLVLMTSAFAEIVRTMLVNLEDFTGGAIGIKMIPPFDILGIPLTSTDKQYYLFLSILIICVLIMFRITHSKWGRLFLAIKDNNESVATCGINITLVKIKAFTVASIFASIAGVMYASMAGYITPSDFSGELGMRYILMMMIGGWANVFGSLFGAALVTILPDVLKFLGDFYWVAFYLIVFAMAILMPGGLVSIFLPGKTFNTAGLEAFRFKKRRKVK